MMKPEKKMKFRIICDDSESIYFIINIIRQGCSNSNFTKETLKERFPTYYPNLEFDVDYIKNSKEIEDFFDEYNKEKDIFKSNKEVL